MNLAVLFVLTGLVFVLAGCVSQPPAFPSPSAVASVCGNGAVETGEQCDGSACQMGYYCNAGCQCVSKPTPPAIPG